MCTPKGNTQRKSEGDNAKQFKEVAMVMIYSRTADAIKVHVDKEDKGVCEMQTPGGVQNVTIINESGLYSLILRSQFPKNCQFKRWVTSEVNDEPFFVGKDVAEILGCKKPENALARHVDEEDKDAVGIHDAIGRQQDITASVRT